MVIVIQTALHNSSFTIQNNVMGRSRILSHWLNESGHKLEAQLENATWQTEQQRWMEKNRKEPSENWSAE